MAQQIKWHKMAGRKSAWYSRLSTTFIVSSWTIFTGAVVGAAYIHKQINDLKRELDNLVPDFIKSQTESYIYHEIPPDEVNAKNEQTVPKYRCFLSKKSPGRGIWTVLKLAQSDDPRARKLAVQFLANARHTSWNDADYCMISQTLDSRTMISLARTRNIDLRFFLPPPNIPLKDISLEQQFLDFLEKFPKSDKESCVQYFMESVRKNLSEENKPEEVRMLHVGGEEFRESVKQSIIQSRQKPLSLSLHALLEHSQLSQNCKTIVDNGGLILLQKVLKMDNIQKPLVHAVAKIIGNLTYHEEFTSKIIQAGWVGILVDWMKGDDLTLVLQATKALINMDQERTHPGSLPNGVLLYHPQYRSHKPPLADVIFIHGLLGSPSWTWRQRKRPLAKLQASKTQPSEVETKTSDDVQDGRNCENDALVDCWPKQWLAKDCPQVRILSLDFQTQLSDWSPRCPYEKHKKTLQAMSEDFLEKLHETGLGRRPIIWVGHSMGGLLIKKILLLAQENKNMQHLVQRTKGIIFYGVPNKGSSLASLSNQTKYLLFPSMEVSELALNSPSLLNLHNQFTSLLQDSEIPLLSFGESLPISLLLNFKAILVPPESSDPGFGEHHTMEDMNHIDICKPDSPHCFLYQLSLRFIRDALDLYLNDTDSDMLG